jgi:hypothetical protein
LTQTGKQASSAIKLGRALLLCDQSPEDHNHRRHGLPENWPDKTIGVRGKYLFSLKDNQTGLLEEVKTALAALIGHCHEFIGTVSTSFTSPAEKVAGLVENRPITVVNLSSGTMSEWLTVGRTGQASKRRQMSIGAPLAVRHGLRPPGQDSRSEGEEYRSPFICLNCLWFPFLILGALYPSPVFDPPRLCCYLLPLLQRLRPHVRYWYYLVRGTTINRYR